MSARCLLVVCIVAGIAALAPDGVAAQMNCRVTTRPLPFGTYAPGVATPLDVTGSIDIRCAGQQGIFIVTIGAGSSGTYAARSMLSGAFTMLYNLYVNSARTLVWGDGTGGSVISGGVKTRNGRQDFSLPVYGRVPPQQSVAAGFYQDDVLVTVIF